MYSSKIQYMLYPAKTINTRFDKTKKITHSRCRVIQLTPMPSLLAMGQSGIGQPWNGLSCSISILGFERRSSAGSPSCRWPAPTMLGHASGITGVVPLADDAGIEAAVVDRAALAVAVSCAAGGS